MAFIEVRTNISPINWENESPWIPIIDPDLIVLMKKSERKIQKFTITNRSYRNLCVKISSHDVDDREFSIPSKGKQDICDDVKGIFGKMAKKNSLISIVEINIKPLNNYGGL